MRFYTSVETYGNNIYLREYDNGTYRNLKIPFQPTLYMKGSGKESEFKSLYGEPVVPMQYSSIKEAKEAVKQYGDAMPIYGMQDWTLQFIGKEYPGTIEFDMRKIRIWSIDIETYIVDAFPNPETANAPVALITVQNYHTGEFFTFGDKPCVTTETNFKHFSTEESLLKAFLNFWSTIRPDVVTGWNIEFFDMPYLYTRIKNVLGEEYARQLSVWGRVDAAKRSFMGKDQFRVYISGLEVMDLLDLYKKFTYVKQESYSLGHVAYMELGEAKVTHDEFESFNDFLTRGFDLAVKYNIHDVRLVTEIDKKLQLLSLAFTLAYNFKINYTDVYGPVKMWDAFIANKLMERNVVVPPNARSGSRSIEGAYVKEPHPGKYRWVVSLDATSLYPSIMKSLNLSPETYLGRDDGIDVEGLLSGKVRNNYEGVAMSAIGCKFSKEARGIIPELIDFGMAERKTAKKKMLSLEQQYQDTKDESLIPQIAAYNAKQMAWKIAANSLFGAMGNGGFRYFDPDVAESITLTGQYFLRSIDRGVNDSLNAMFKTGDHKYCIYQDTDSCAGDSVIVVNGRRMTIAEFFDGCGGELVRSDETNKDFVKRLVGKGFMTPSVSKEGSLRNNEIKYVMKHKVKKRMFRITVQGKSVEITEDHSLIVKRYDKLLSIKPTEVVAQDKILYIL